MKVVADPEAIAFIRARGGRVFVWADASGLKRVKTTQARGVEFNEVAADGFQLMVATDLMLPRTFTVLLHRLPVRHLDVLWDGEQPGVGFVGFR